MKNIITNPYLEVGNLHNQGLEQVISRLSPYDVSRPVTIERIIQATCDYLKSISGINTRINPAIDYAFIAKTINELELKSLSEILRHARLNEKMVCFINGMLHISDNTDYETALKFVENIEENILFAEISENEKQLPLLFAAVAKSSINYWLDQFKMPVGKPSLWEDFVVAAGETMDTAKWAWREDAQGALAGMFSGALAGMFTSGVPGAGTIAFNAAVGCSIAASVATVFNKSFKN